jgi:spore coat polysaccharide biosynthesis protein SpsF (cytidylyltransferase family)
MSSSRFPGKSLVPFDGKPLIENIIVQLCKVIRREEIMLATSTDRTDDAIQEFAETRQVKIFRGSLEDVWSRFYAITQNNRNEWIGRICGDSPLISSTLISAMLKKVSPRYDIVTNIYPRSFPHGQSFEIIHRSVMLNKKYAPKNQKEREHVTSHLYKLANLRILNHRNQKGNQSCLSWSVENPQDIARLQKVNSE